MDTTTLLAVLAMTLGPPLLGDLADRARAWRRHLLEPAGARSEPALGRHPLPATSCPASS